MTSNEIIQELERYRAELTQIMARFERRPRSLNINRHDDPRYRSYVIEIIDLLNDTLGENKYSLLINQIFVEGISNYIQSPSYKSVEDIVSVIDSALTRLKRNPDFYVKEVNSSIESTSIQNELTPPAKVTLKWLWEHVPYRLWFYLIGLLISAFTLGVTFSETKMYKSAISLLDPNTNAEKKTTMVKE